MNKELRQIANEMEQTFSPIQNFTYLNFYSNTNFDTGKRESWAEGVERAVTILGDLSNWQLPEETYNSIYKGIAQMDVLPSMRLFSQTPEYIAKNKLAIYNCSYLPISTISDIVDVLTLSMSGCGVGYSVQHDHIKYLPVVPRDTITYYEPYFIEDSSEGWSQAFGTLLYSYLLNSTKLQFNYSRIRPAGSLLMTKNGIASGPEPLKELFDHTYKVLDRAAGRKLTSLDVMDIVDKIAECAISGGNRRGALICLFDWDDDLMLKAKHREDLFSNPDTKHWANSNNSAVLKKELSQKEVQAFMNDNVFSVYSEPGIFNLKAHIDTMPKRRRALWSDEQLMSAGTQPCNEIFLAPYGLCNLSTIVAKPEDDLASLVHKQQLSAIIGTIQSMADTFDNVNPRFQETERKERLLGCNITNVWGCKAVQNATNLLTLKNVAVDTNKDYARHLGINRSSAVTSVKPAGNTSVLLGAGSWGSPGVNPVQFSGGIVRNIKLHEKSAMTKMFIDNNVPIIKHPYDNDHYLAQFPVEIPSGIVTAEDVTALQQLEMYKLYVKHYTEHSVSISVQYDDHEKEQIIEWIYKNQGIFKSVAFMQRFNESFPYLPIAKANGELKDLQNQWGEFNWQEQLQRYDIEKLVDAGCGGGACVIGFSGN